MVIITAHWVKNILKIVLILFLLGGCASKPQKPIADPLVERHEQWQQQVESGNQALQNQDTRRAIEAYQKAIEIQPNENAPRLKIAELYFQLHEYENARDAFTAYLKLDPKNVNARNYLGYIYEDKLRNYEAAAQQYENAREIDPRSLYTLVHLGLVYIQLQRLDEAEAVLSRALEIDPEVTRPESKNLHSYLGLIHLKKGQRDRAIAEFQASIRRNPNDTWAHAQLEAIGADENLPMISSESVCAENNRLGEDVSNWQKAYGRPRIYPDVKGCMENRGAISLSGNRRYGDAVFQVLNTLHKIKAGKRYTVSFCANMNLKQLNYVRFRVLAFNGTLPEDGRHPVASPDVDVIGETGNIIAPEWTHHILPTWLAEKDFENIAVVAITEAVSVGYGNVSNVCLHEANEQMSE